VHRVERLQGLHRCKVASACETGRWWHHAQLASGSTGQALAARGRPRSTSQGFKREERIWKERRKVQPGRLHTRKPMARLCRGKGTQGTRGSETQERVNVQGLQWHGRGGKEERK
jgi:hypothetical protein